MYNFPTIEYEKDTPIFRLDNISLDAAEPIYVMTNNNKEIVNNANYYPNNITQVKKLEYSLDNKLSKFVKINMHPNEILDFKLERITSDNEPELYIQVFMSIIKYRLANISSDYISPKYCLVNNKMKM